MSEEISGSATIDLRRRHDWLDDVNEKIHTDGPVRVELDIGGRKEENLLLAGASIYVSADSQENTLTINLIADEAKSVSFHDWQEGNWE